eukprot:NODE_166_length_16344_cov_0.418775.p10 type:complete len:117 gc:universal NODE_166_length_16344_cov_0.418775:2758-3108(+)
MGKFDPFVDYYELFQVPSNAKMNTIYKRYKQLALKYHPDKYGGSKIFLLLQQGLDVLENSRSEYDRAYGMNKSECAVKKESREFVVIKTLIELDLINSKRCGIDLEAYEDQVFEHI